MNAKHASAEVRRQQFFEAALEVCSNKGYHATRMDDIAAQAGLSKGSLYHHFESKEQLFLQLVESIYAELEEMLQEDLASELSAREVIGHLYDYFTQHFASRPTLLRGLFEFIMLGLRHEEFRVRFQTRYEEGIAQLAQIVDVGKAQGDFAEDIDSVQVARIFALSGDGMLMLYHAMGWQERSVEDARLQLEIFLRGLAPRPER